MPEVQGWEVAQQAALAAGPPPIKGFLDTSFVDWRGRIAAVLFLPGCNFRCPYCHNFTLVSDPDSLLSIPLDEMLDRLSPFVGWIDGVVVSGGEPTLHPGLPWLLASIKEAGFAVKLDTNGSRPGALKQVVEAGLVDMVAMDLKAPLDPMAYRRAAGVAVNLTSLRDSVEFIMSCGLPHEFRSTIWPAWHQPDQLRAMGAELRGAQRWVLQNLNPETAWNKEALGTGKSFAPEELERLQGEVNGLI